MRASARVVAVADGGRTRLAVLRGEPPLLPRPTLAAPDGSAVVHLVGGAAGPLGGDRLRLSVVVASGASLRLGTVAATVALPGRDGAWSRLEVDVEVAPGGALTWLPEPLVAAGGCAHETSASVALHGDARLVWLDELVCGRHGEDGGDARVRTEVRLDGRPLYRNELAVGPGAAGWSGPAVLGAGGRAAGSLLVVDPALAGCRPSARPLGPTAAVMPLAGPAVLACATGAGLPEVRAQLRGAELTPWSKESLVTSRSSLPAPAV